MAKFERKFETRGDSDHRLLDDLLSLWTPSGVDSGEAGLRLAIRNGYLNFYYQGQSVAKISYDRHNDLKAKVHGRYIDTKQQDQTYKTILSKDYADKTQILKWTKNTLEYAGGEKRFVNQVVGKNSNVIDLEMGLPYDASVPLAASTKAANKENGKTAVRMDLVALEKNELVWTIVFWEAKLVTNRQARRAGSDLPEVCTQLENYTSWIEHNKANVIKEYQNNCKVLCDLHKRALKVTPNKKPLGEGIVAVADGAALDLDTKPRLIIDNQIPSSSFEPHRAKLRAHGIHVQMVNKGGKFVLESRQ